jgi:NAD(P)H-hydrate epimerase
MTSLTRAQVRELDRRAIEEYGVPGVVLMENAGRGAAEVLMRLNPERLPVVICCGKGNNGGDGFVIARHLDIHGWPVRNVFIFGSDLSGDAAINMRVIDRGGPRPGFLTALVGQGFNNYLVKFVTMHDGWIVDALFGTGLTGPLTEPYDQAVAAINASQAQVLAVDIPSGLDCDTGKPLGPCVRADHTVTFVAPKAGFANPESREWLGQVHVVGIGAPRVLLEQYGL